MVFCDFLRVQDSFVSTKLPFSAVEPPKTDHGTIGAPFATQQAAFDFFAGWGRTAGGFAVPRGHDKFSGVSFKKELIFEVLNIKSSSTSDINKLFAPERLEKAPRAKAWLNSKGETNDDSFRKMTTIGLKKYLQEDHRKPWSRTQVSKIRIGKRG
ncbi:hypothetical protein B0H14DRAFT_3429730 [Mycena olivaceomarginata]|nr:hypothetical protein B0H14DRAFT_3429730 [Mycena olivaceomarginata]